MHKTSIQINDLTTGKETYGKKITVDLESGLVIALIEKLVAGHLVTRNSPRQKGRDLRRKDA